MKISGIFTLVFVLAPAFSYADDTAKQAEFERLTFQLVFEKVRQKDDRCTFYTDKMQWNTENANNPRKRGVCHLKQDNSVACENVDPSEGVYDSATNEITLYKLNHKLLTGRLVTTYPPDPSVVGVKMYFLYVITFNIGESKGTASYRLVDRNALSINPDEPMNIAHSFRSSDHFLYILPLHTNLRSKI